jgi:predicted nucleotidyltransferase
MEEECNIIVLVSSCFTQRGDVSYMDKWKRTQLLLDNGVDMVVEFPFGYASQGADIFAEGAIKILSKLKIDILVFGTDTLNICELTKIANLQLNSEKYNSLVLELLDTGLNYPTAMSSAIYKLLSLKINKANDLLGLSYVKEIIKQNVLIEPITIKRTNDYHDLSCNSEIISGSAIRKLISKDKSIKKYVVDDKAVYCYNEVNREKLFPLLKYQIINNINSLDKFHTVDEGIDNRIKKMIFNCSSWEELVFMIKTKRYTYNKINRMLMHILTNFTKEENKNIDIDYIRVLGFTIKGQQHLNKIKKELNVPIITRYKRNISLLLDIEFRVQAIYGSMLEKGNDNIMKEYNCKPIIKAI